MKKLSLFLVVLACLLVSCKPEAEKPTVITKSVGEVTKTSAKVVGQVTADGEAEVTERGVCWNTEGAPEIIDYRTVDGKGIGTYTSDVNDLDPNTTYYVRAYATNEKGTSYGEEKSFTTLEGNDNEGGNGDIEADLPEVVTVEVTNVCPISAVISSEILSDGGFFITAKGVCWSTNPNPTINDSKTNDGSGANSFVSELTQLETGTTYYVRAYATNEAGTGYGSIYEFMTPDLVDLGLPSGLKWATNNVGARKPEDYGDYFAWGEVTPKAEYTKDNCMSIGSYGGSDAAYANWDGWRMPAETEMRELVYNCTWEWITQNGVKGYKVTGPNGNSIFLPAAGCRYGSSLNGAGEYGRYWSASIYYKEIDQGAGHYDYDYLGNVFAFSLNFDSSVHYVYDNFRYFGQSVRPVSE